MNGNNAHWISAGLISHQSFNTSYSRLYMRPAGTILKVFSWGEEEMEPDDTVREAVQKIREACICGLGVNLLGEPASYSPYLTIGGLIKGNLPLLQRAYFSEHTTDDKGQGERMKALFPDRSEDIAFFEAFVQKHVTEKVK